MLSLAAPEAAAQCTTTEAHEVAVELLPGVVAAEIQIRRGGDGAIIYGPHPITPRGVYPASGRCDWYWEIGTFGAQNPDFECELGVSPCTDSTFVIQINETAYVYAPGYSAYTTPPGTFYFPAVTQIGASLDVGFAVAPRAGGGTRVLAINGIPSHGATSLNYYENVLPHGYVIPYNLPLVAAAGGNASGIDAFLTPISTSCGPLPFTQLPACMSDTRVYRFAPAGNVTIPAAWSPVWDVPGLTLEFAPGTRLVVSGQLDARGTTLTAANATQGWFGSLVDGGSLTLGAGTTVEQVRNPCQGSFVCDPVNALTVANSGQATIDGATIQDTGTGAGVAVTGANSTAHLSSSAGTTFIQRTTNGPAVLATSGGSAVIDGDAVQITNNASGIAATGTGSSVLVTGATVFQNFGPAVRASGGGRVDILRYTGYTPPTTINPPVTLDNNVGGLYAVASGKTGGGVVFTGEHVYECDPSGCANPSVGNHNVTNNDLGAAFDIQSRGGSVVLATENYWGPAASAYDTTAVERDRDTQSFIAYLPVLTAPASLTGGPAASRGVAGGVQASAAALDSETGAARASVDVLALLGEAEARTQAGDSTEAAARILVAWALSASDDDRTAVAEAAGRTLAAMEPAALVAWTDAAGLWGARARAAGLVGQERYAEATAAAGVLAAETGTGDTALGHRARGLSLLVEAAVGAHDAAAAVSSLTDLAEIDPEGAADLALSVAVAFPDAPLTLGRGTATGSLASAAGKTTPEASGLALVAGPNPSSGAVRVSLTLAEASEATVAVFDALGRQVAVLHEGTASGTVEASFDGRTLPAGVYVVRAVVRGATASVLTRTVTVAR